MQVAGQGSVIIPAGGTFIERPEDIHSISRNASQTSPATFLVIALKNVDQPLSASAEPSGK
jgi:hypothetical protein